MSTDNPRAAYERYHAGEAVGQFETDARTWSAPLQTILNVIEYGEIQYATTATVAVEATKPDPRLSLELFIGYVPRDEDQILDLDVVTGNGQTVAQNLHDSKVWLALLCDFGGGVRESENIVGTRAAPVPFVDLGLWGVTWEVDLDCVAVRARLDLVSGGVFGRWMVGARWTAVEPMSQRDWEHARQNMRVVTHPRQPPAIEVMRTLEPS